MDRRKLLVAFVALSCPSVIVVGSAQDHLTIDATRQPAPPLRGRGPYPGSPAPVHSVGLPVQLEVRIPTGRLRPDGTALVDFIITNVGTESITLPASIDHNIERTDVLTLWLTSDAIKDVYLKDQQTGRLVKVEAVETSAELYGCSTDPQTFHVLTPNETIRVRASSRVGLNPGTHSVTGHAELVRVPHQSTEVVGTAEAIPVTIALSNPAVR
jgi:hypothetical protein